MRLLIDGNIILDVLQNREPHVVDSAKIWKLCETDQAEGYVSGTDFFKSGLHYAQGAKSREDK